MASATLFTVALGGLLSLDVVHPASAAAAVGPIAQRGAGAVTADALPTVQIDGVVWDQEIVGDTVYAGGQFTNARPAGAAPGTSLTPRSNLLAYNIRTGTLITTFAPTVNGKIKTLAVSPDGTRLYIGGSFTQVNGLNRYRIASFDTATGALTSFAPSPDSSVNAIAVSSTAVYAGGAFSKVGSTSRVRLAAFSPTNGALLGWAPTADFGVNALLMTPDKSRVLVAGAFGMVNSSTATGLASLDATTGALLPWAANQVIHDYGSSAAMLSLSTDGTNVYSGGYWYGGTGNFEGVLAADPNTGAIKWLADCHGDTYDASAVNGTVYAVSHHHYCTNIGGFPDTNPRTVWHRANAFTSQATGTVAHNGQGGYADFFGQPAPSIVNWFPDVDSGTYTGQSQGGWTTTGNKEYVVQGGEFPKVNGVAQQGLVRFAIPSIAPKKQGPRVAGAAFNPTVLAVDAKTVRVKWQANWDRDDQALSYSVLRSDLTTPVFTGAQTSQFWNRPAMSVTDTTVVAGKTYRYKVTATDPDGNIASSEYVSIAVPATTNAYVAQVVQDGASNYWRMNGTTSYPDYLGATDLTASTGVTASPSGAITGDSDGAAAFDGSTGSAGTSTAVSGPDTFTVEAWFKTTSTTGGKIVGFGSASTGASNSYDRHIYMDNAGRLDFGVYNGNVSTVRSATAYNDGAWHHVAAELSPAGMVFYVDGANVGGNPGVTSAQSYSGFWRVGYDNLSGWPNPPSSNFLNGVIDEVAIYPTALSASQVQAHYSAASAAGTPPPVNASPTAAFTSSCTNLACSFDGSSSTDTDGTIATYAWDFGDGGTSAVAKPTHTFAAQGTYPVKLTVTDDDGAVDVVTKSVIATMAVNAKPTAVLSADCTALSCAVDGTGSTDADGTVSSYDWDFGDSSTSTQGKTTHQYTSGGTYTITLKVTDDGGATDTATKTVTVAAAGNQPPTAAFTSAVSALTASFDGSGSSDPDGDALSYAWQFGDGSTGTGVSPSHTYTGTGYYAVSLKVSDGAGGADTVTKTVRVATGPVAADAFDRNVTRWGTADLGGAWTYSGSTFSTNGSTGDVKVATAGASARGALAGVSQQDVNVVTDLSLDTAATGGGVYNTLIVRKIGTSDYRMSVQHVSGGAVRLKLVRTVSGTATTLKEVAVSGVSATAGDVYRARLQVSGSSTTTLSGKLWKAGTAEPASAQVTATDTTAALQAPGSFALDSYVSSSTTTIPKTSFDNLVITSK